jgi:hypothetical protein
LNRVRWHYRDASLVWLFPCCYALHLLEEWLGGFPEWVALVAGAELPRAAFISINAVAMLMMLLAARAAVKSERDGWMAIAIATILLINGIGHVLGSLVTRSYSPGLFTGVVLYLPIAQLALMRAWEQSRPALLLRGVIVGTAVHAAVVVIAYSLVA